MIVFTFTQSGDCRMMSQPLIDADGRAPARPPMPGPVPAADGGQRPLSSGSESLRWLGIDQVAKWQLYARCRGLGAELFFPVGETGSDAVEHAARAKAVCRRCPVRASCLEFSLTTNQEFGVWGGLTEHERRSLRRTKRRRTPPPWDGPELPGGVRDA